MVSNFSISTHRNSENLHVKLNGDFDGSSAMQLINILKKYGKNGFNKIIIHTSCLDEIYPCGMHTFHENLRKLNGHTSRLLFTGEKANQIASEKGVCL